MHLEMHFLCTAPPSRLHRAVLPHTKTLAVFPPANPRDRTRLWARVARVQRRQSSRGRPPSSLVANPFPWPCCYRFNPPVAAALPPLLHSSASPPATARSSSTTVPSVVIHSLFAQKNRLSSRRYTLVPSLAPTFPSSTLLDTTDARENTTSPLVSARHIPSSCEFLIPPTAARQTIKPRGAHPHHISRALHHHTLPLLYAGTPIPVVTADSASSRSPANCPRRIPRPPSLPSLPSRGRPTNITLAPAMRQ